MFDGIVSFVVVFGSLSLISWSFYTVIVSQISNIEKAFGLSSSETGWLLTIWELGYVICTILASYFGPRAHLPRVIGIATVICGLSGFVFALPHFVAFTDSKDNNEYNDTVDSNKSDVSLCESVQLAVNRTVIESSSAALGHITKGSSKTIAYALFVIGMLVQGAGKAPCYPYSAQYVDDNVDKQKTGFYTGTISSIAVFGFAVGYGIGSLISNVHVTLKSTTLSSTDTRFIGAWWLGFLLVGTATILIAIPMFCFPRKFSTTPEKTHEEALHTNEIKRVLSTLLTVVKSVIYILTLVAACFQILSFSVFLGFEPKYIETQFAMPSWQVNILLGVISIVSYSIGCLLGGFITKKWDLSLFKTLILVVCLNALVTLVLVGATFLGCSHHTVQNSPTDQTYLSAGMDCDCSATEFLPVCGEDKQTYFSACHAGCTDISGDRLSNCSAIPGGDATMGLCPRRCSMVWPYSVVKFIMNLIDATASIPIFLVFLRSAGEKNKALAIGLSAAITSVCAWLPGPVIGGKLIDSSCLIWNTARTSGKYCAYYNIEWQRFRLHGCMIGLRVVGLMIFGLGAYKARGIPHWPKDETLDYELVNTCENGKPPESIKALQYDKVHEEKQQ